MSASFPTMKAVRLYGPRDLRVDQIPHPGQPGPGQALLRVTAVGVCGSDFPLRHGGSFFIAFYSMKRSIVFDCAT